MLTQLPQCIKYCLQTAFVVVTGRDLIAKTIHGSERRVVLSSWQWTMGTSIHLAAWDNTMQSKSHHTPPAIKKRSCLPERNEMRSTATNGMESKDPSDTRAGAINRVLLTEE